MDVIPSNWYKNWFGNEYLTLYAHRDEREASKLINLVHSNISLQPGSSIIDLCCGQGRHAKLLAQQDFKVVGVDLSKTLLEVAKYQNAGAQNATFVQADMRYLPFLDKFDLLLNLFTSFGYFESDNENLKVFKQFALVLKKTGYFVFDYLNEHHVRANFIPQQTDTIGDFKINLKRKIANGHVQKKITMNYHGRESIFYESVKMYSVDQIKHMLKCAGLTADKIMGDYSGNIFSTSAPRLIIIGSKER
jgi:ubiquinone/menaquinone biosynthesis C-methylase UbiE